MGIRTHCDWCGTSRPGTEWSLWLTVRVVDEPADTLFFCSEKCRSEGVVEHVEQRQTRHYIMRSVGIDGEKERVDLGFGDEVRLDCVGCRCSWSSGSVLSKFRACTVFCPFCGKVMGAIYADEGPVTFYKRRPLPELSAEELSEIARNSDQSFIPRP